MRFQLACLASIASCLFATSREAGAESVTYNFSGTLDLVTVQGTASVPDEVTVGAAFTGSVTLQLAPTVGVAVATYRDKVLDLTFTVGSTSFDKALVDSYQSDSYFNIVKVYDNAPTFPSGQYFDAVSTYVDSSYSGDPNHKTNGHITLNLFDQEASPTALSSTAIPAGPLDLSKFITQHLVQFTREDYNPATFDYYSLLQVRGNLTSLELVPTVVPAPPAVVMLGLGLSWTAAWHRTRRRAA